MKTQEKFILFLKNNFPQIIPFLRFLKKNRKSLHYKLMPTESVFTEIYRNNSWHEEESRSGSGSTLERTETLRKILPQIFSEFNINSILDIPCGDFNWFKEIQLNSISYIGADIVSDIIINNQKNYSDDNRKFIKLDILNDPLPKVDLILCRDLFIHFSLKHIKLAMENILKSKSKYLLTTSYPDIKNDKDIVTGDFHRINLLEQPFSFGKPILVIDEKNDEGKNLLLFKISEIRINIL